MDKQKSKSDLKGSLKIAQGPIGRKFHVHGKND